MPALRSPGTFHGEAPFGFIVGLNCVCRNPVGKHVALDGQFEAKGGGVMKALLILIVLALPLLAGLALVVDGVRRGIRELRETTCDSDA